MKSFIIFAVFFGIVIFACKDDPAPPVFMAEGQITGPDARLCPCCGGWLLETADTTFLFDYLPAGSTIDLNNATFPILVKFDYQTDTSICNGWGNRIILTEIELQ